MRFVFSFLLGLLSFSAVPAHAQTPVAMYCWQGPTNPQWAPCPANIPTIIGSTTIATGNTFQSVLTASASRKSLHIQNNNTNGDNCWVYVGANGSATKAASIILSPGGSYQRYFPYIPSDNISATCATTSDTLYVDSQ